MPARELAKKKATPAPKSTKAAKVTRKPAAKTAKTSKKSKPGARDAARNPMRTPAASRPAFVPRAVANLDDDDVLMAHGGGGGGFGRCGGRLLASRTEQQLCQRLGLAGVVHSHSPRHYEVRYPEGLVAAYAPMIVLRGRGREGKSVVIEAVEETDAPILRKVTAFRSQYGQEFYVILVAADDILDAVPLAAFDESCATTNVNTLIARLAE
ncbi:MAG: hypothetical protein JNK78_16665 [Planctomycetes bacterium]|nr:hypothetical protein [Planctomycetota bacterium]